MTLEEVAIRRRNKIRKEILAAEQKREERKRLAAESAKLSASRFPVFEWTGEVSRGIF